MFTSVAPLHSDLPPPPPPLFVCCDSPPLASQYHGDIKACVAVTTARLHPLTQTSFLSFQTGFPNWPAPHAGRAEVTWRMNVERVLVSRLCQFRKDFRKLMMNPPSGGRRGRGHAVRSNAASDRRRPQVHDGPLKDRKSLLPEKWKSFLVLLPNKFPVKNQ